MLVLFLFCAVMGAVALIFSRVLEEAVVDREVDPDAAVRPSRVRPRLWALPMFALGTLGLTLHLIGRDPATTLVASAVVGIPAGLIANLLAELVAKG